MIYIKQVLPVFLLSTLLVSCMNSLTGQRVKGDGNVVKETREVAPFNSMKIEGIFNVFLHQDGQEKAVIETDKNLLPYIVVKTVDGQLLLSWRKDISISKSTKMRIDVSLKDLKQLDIEGIGKVETVGAINVDELNLNISGVGKTKLELNTDKLVANINAVGAVDLSGRAENASLDIEGVGKVSAEDLVCKRLVLENSGVGKVSVHATQFLHIDSDGIGKVSYTGNPEIKEITANGIGKVSEM